MVTPEQVIEAYTQYRRRLAAIRLEFAKQASQKYRRKLAAMVRLRAQPNPANPEKPYGITAAETFATSDPEYAKWIVQHLEMEATVLCLEDHLRSLVLVYKATGSNNTLDPQVLELDDGRIDT